jgi:isoaspartyl peptidase/L-asparaginase-like protein (Ntn-hydrolase superfamily)
MSQKKFAFALHGGAGARSGRDYSVAEFHMRELTENARDRLAAGGRALDVVEYAVAEMESSGIYVAGRGSAPNSAGHVELDASIMDGPVSAAGAVASIRDVVNPVSVRSSLPAHKVLRRWKIPGSITPCQSA